jgi:hypothetical protein
VFERAFDSKVSGASSTESKPELNEKPSPGSGKNVVFDWLYPERLNANKANKK